MKAAQIRGLVAAIGSDARWATVRPPLTAMPEEAGRELAGILKREFDFELLPDCKDQGLGDSLSPSRT